jgi:hypothetical protein
MLVIKFGASHVVLCLFHTQRHLSHWDYSGNPGRKGWQRQVSPPDCPGSSEIRSTGDARDRTVVVDRPEGAGNNLGRALCRKPAMTTFISIQWRVRTAAGCSECLTQYHLHVEHISSYNVHPTALRECCFWFMNPAQLWSCTITLFHTSNVCRYSSLTVACN